MTLRWQIENATGPVADLAIFDDIGEGGTSVAQFTRDLAGVRARELRLTIHSEGGSAIDGLAIHDSLRAWPGFVTSLVSLAASAASVIALACDRVLMMPTGALYIHEPYLSSASGDAADLRRAADLTDKIADQIASVYKSRAGGSIASWRDTMRTARWYTAQEAVAAGLADGIEEPAKVRPLPVPILAKLDHATKGTLIRSMVREAVAAEVAAAVGVATRSAMRNVIASGALQSRRRR